MAKVPAITAKKAAVSAKGARMSVCAEIKGRLWEAFPPTCDENKKGWRTRVSRDLTELARKLGYKDVQVTPRRVRAFMNDEARRIDHIEVKLIEMREKLNQRQERVPTRRERAHDIKAKFAELRSAQGSGDAYRGSGGTGEADGRSLGTGSSRSGESERSASVQETEG